MRIFQVQRRAVAEKNFAPDQWFTEARAADLEGAMEYMAKNARDWTEMRILVDPREADAALRAATEDLP